MLDDSALAASGQDDGNAAGTRTTATDGVDEFGGRTFLDLLGAGADVPMFKNISSTASSPNNASAAIGQDDDSVAGTGVMVMNGANESGSVLTCRCRRISVVRVRAKISRRRMDLRPLGKRWPEEKIPSYKNPQGRMPRGTKILKGGGGGDAAQALTVDEYVRYQGASLQDAQA